MMVLRTVARASPETKQNKLFCCVLQALIYIVFGVERRVGCRENAAERLIKKLWPDGKVLLESHPVVTGDGYDLVLHRLRLRESKDLRREPSRPMHPALLMHGLFESSIVWFAQGKDSLAYRLLQDGRDVWLGNARGNGYSSGRWGLWGRRAHAWTSEDRAREDFPTTMEYVLSTTGADQLLYVGQSQGAALAVEGLALQPDLCEKVSSLVLFTPALCVRRPENIVVRAIISHLPMFSYRVIYVLLALVQCTVPDACLVPAGKRAMRAMAWLKHPYNTVATPALFRGIPSGGTSSANLGRLLNMVATGERSACEVSRVTCPVYCYLGGEDDCIDTKGSVELMRRLPNLKAFRVQPGYAHVDFVWTTDAPQTIYEPLISEIRESASRVVSSAANARKAKHDGDGPGISIPSSRRIMPRLGGA